MKTAHLAHDTYHDSNGPQTLCGEPWEPWQEPVPTDEEIGFADLPYAVAVEVRKSDALRRAQPGEAVRQCQACFNLATGRR